MRRILIAGSAAVILIVLLLVVWSVVVVRSTWDRLDKAAEAYEPPTGFEVVAQVRQGTALCFITCDHGGGAVVTILMTVDRSAQQACDGIRATVDAVAKSRAVEHEVPDFECVWSGALGDGALVDGVVMRRDELRPLGPAGVYGPRWTEAVEIPDTTLLAWVEFDSGLT